MSVENINELVDTAVQDRLNKLGLAPEDASTVINNRAKEHEKEAQVRALLDNNGFLDSEARHRFASGKEAWEARVSYNELVDALSTTQFEHLIPRVISQVVREAIEPQLNLTRLLRPIRFSAGTQITFPAVSAMAGVRDMGETDEYPELQGPRFAGTMTVVIGKVGCSVRVTEEVLRYSQWDIMSMLMRGAGRALARHKEQKVANLLTQNAILSYDNDTPGNAVNGSTTGRALTGAANSTLRLDDLFVVYAQMVNDGFIPNTILMNALGWLIFARDPSMRAFGFANGGPLFRTVQGASGTDPSWDPALYQRPTAQNLSYSSQTFVDVPNLFPVPLALVISPFINHDISGNKTDLFMVDREELGLLVIDEDVMTDQFDDPKRDMRMVKFRERYGLQLLNEGQAARRFANISLDRGYDFEDTKTGWDLATAPLP